MGGNFDGGIIARILQHPCFGRLFSKFALASFMVLPLVSASAAMPFLRSDATYVLLSGLPGDLESESTYRDQLQAWLEIVGGIRPQQVIVLTDNPENVRGATTSNSLTFLPSSRSNFLALDSLIASPTNPLILIVWGHGGKQGNTPVFHVRGPRITAADFSTFADHTGSVESRWLLSFRGSGLIAGKLVGPHREILSSESDTMFNSDPVEMSLMLKILRETPGISFEPFGSSVDHATAK